MTAISVTVNGRPHVAEVEPRRLLVDVLRQDLGLTGTHIGCEHGVCGTCTVLLDGHTRPVLHHPRGAGRRRRDHARSRASPPPASELHPMQEAFGRSRACSAATARPGWCCARSRSWPENPDPEPGRGARGHRQQPLPLHRLPVHRRCRSTPRPSGCEPEGGCLDDQPRSCPARSGRGPGRSGPPSPQRRPTGAGSASRSAGSRIPSTCAASASTSPTGRLPGMLHAAVLRSPYPHAGSPASTCSAARALPGVSGGGHRAAEAAELRRPAARLRPRARPSTSSGVLAVDKVRYVGEGVAVVVAESRYMAEDALRPDRGRATSRSTRSSTRGRRWPTRPRSSTRRSARTSPTSAPSASATSSRTSPRPTSSSRTGCTGIAAPPSRSTTRARSPIYDPGSGELTIDGNSISITWFAFLARERAQGAGQQAEHHPVPVRRQLRRPLLATGGRSSPPAHGARSRGGRSSTSRTGSTTSPTATSTPRDRYYERRAGADAATGPFESFRTDVVDDYGAYI